MYSLRCEPSSQVSDNVSSLLKDRLQSSVPSNSPQTYTRRCLRGGVVRDVHSATSVSTSLWPSPGSVSSHLSFTLAIAPTLLSGFCSSTAKNEERYGHGNE